MRVTLYADYAPWPLWSNGLSDEDALPLSEATKTRIKAWFNAYDESPKPDWPVWIAPSGATSADEVEKAWVAEGEALRAVIQRELGPDYEVIFET